MAAQRAAVAASFRAGMLCRCSVGRGGAAVRGEAAVPHISCRRVTFLSLASNKGNVYERLGLLKSYLLTRILGVLL